MARPTLDNTMMEVAATMSLRGTCAKKQVGCVLVDDRGNVLATGYNGQPRGRSHCTPVTPCPAYLDANLSCQAIHAEMNALLRCHDVDRIHSAYVTEQPCEKCRMLLLNTGCKRIVSPGWVDLLA